MKQIFVPLILIFLVILNYTETRAQLQSDTIISWMDDVYLCPCQSPAQHIIVPIKVSNFDSVCSITLSLWYKNSALEWEGYQHVNPALAVATAFHSIEGNLDQFRFASFSSVPMNLPDSSTLLELKFKVLCDTTILQWDTWNPGANLYSKCNDTSMIVAPQIFKNAVITESLNFTLQPSSVSVYPYQSAHFSCLASALAGVPSYQWQVKVDSVSPWTNLLNNSIYSNVTSDTLYVINPDLGFNGFSFRCVASSCTVTQYSNVAVLTVTDTLLPSTSTLEGYVSYENNLQSPLAFSQVNLMQNSITLFSVISDSSGYFKFTAVPMGNYQLEALPIQSFGGVNSSDGLKILKHFTGLSLLTALPLLASDVDSNGTTNSIDALMCVERFVGMITSFQAGDWLSEKPTVISTGNNSINQNIKVLCSGDVDASYIP